MSESTEDWHLQDDDLPPPLNMTINSVSTPQTSTQSSFSLADAHSVASLMNSPTSTYTSEYHDHEPAFTTFNPSQVIAPYHSTLGVDSKMDTFNAFSDDSMPIAMSLPHHAGLHAVCNLAYSFENIRHQPALDQPAYSQDTESFNYLRARSRSPLYLNSNYVGNAFQPSNIPYSVNPLELCCASSIDVQYSGEISIGDESGLVWNDASTSINPRYPGIHSIENNHHFSTVEHSNMDMTTLCENASSNPSQALENHPLTLQSQHQLVCDLHTPWLIEHSNWSTTDNVPKCAQRQPAQQPKQVENFTVGEDQISTPAEASLSETINNSPASRNEIETSDITFVDVTSPPRRVFHRRGSFPVEVEQRTAPADAFRRGHTRAISDTGIRGNTSATSSADTFQDGSLKICSNCRTRVTPSWRRCAEGKRLLCNACGLYQKLHRKDRPIYQAADGKIKVRRAPLGSAVAQPIGYSDAFGSTGQGAYSDTTASYPMGSSPTTISCHSSDDSGSDSAAPNTPEASDICGICGNGQSSLRTIMQSDCTKGLICEQASTAAKFC